MIKTDEQMLASQAGLEWTAGQDVFEALGLTREDYIRSRFRDERLTPPDKNQASKLAALSGMAPTTAARARLEFAQQRQAFERLRVSELDYVRSRLKSEGFAAPACA